MFDELLTQTASSPQCLQFRFFCCFECLLRPSAFIISFVLSVQSPVGNSPKDPALRAKLVNILNHVLTRAKGNAVRDSVKGLSCATCAHQFVTCMLCSNLT